MNPIWTPTNEDIQKTHLHRLMTRLNHKTYESFFSWAAMERADFWETMIQALSISFNQPPRKILNLEKGIAQPQWLEGAQFNIASSCFKAKADQTAILFQRSATDPLQRMTYQELDQLSNRVANGLIQAGMKTGEAVAIDMVMTAEAVAIYLGIIKAGGVAVSIADSFAPDEIATRLRISKSKFAFTQDHTLRAGKKIELYSKVKTAVESFDPQIRIITLGYDIEKNPDASLRAIDLTWNSFLSKQTSFDPIAGDPETPTNILFSSGTTGDPKAIPWTHLTPIKAASDAYLHHDIHPEDILCWPTNLGWMMGPWLIYAALINRATIALYYAGPTGQDFGKFVQDAGVTMLGVIPSIVKVWKQSDCMRAFNWLKIKKFSSTGECSNPTDMAFLMALAGGKPVIEYCGGTEIGGAYLTSTMIQPNLPSTFTTPSLGLDLVILDEEGRPTQNGELFLIPPSIGLSNSLLNRDHKEVYYADTPRGPGGEILRRHGDQVEALPGGGFRAHGRADDTMNLGGIKTSSAEIERVLNTIPGIQETAAIAVSPPGGGPSELVIYAVAIPTADKEKLRSPMQSAIKEKLNPLFKISDLVFTDSLPRTASNKVMRRVIRSQYQERIKSAPRT